MARKPKTFKGTKLTGTRTLGTIFLQSDVKSAIRGDKYHNTKTGHNYKCIVAGKPKNAKWVYTSTSILGKPKKEKTGETIDFIWDDDFVSDDTDRLTMYARYEVSLDPDYKYDLYRPTYVMVSIYDGTTRVHTSGKLNDRYRPYSSSWYFTPSAKEYDLNVYCGNKKGEVLVSTRKVKSPSNQPNVQISASHNGSTITMRAKVAANTKTLRHLDSYFTCEVKDNRGPLNSGVYMWIESTDGAQKTLEYTPSNLTTYTDGKYLVVTPQVRTWALNRNINYTNWTPIYIGQPRYLSLKANSIPDRSNPNNSAVFKVANDDRLLGTEIVLQVLKDTTAETESEAQATSGWTDIRTTKVGTTYFNVPASELIPRVTKKTWVRLVSWGFNRQSLSRVSNAIRLNSLEQLVTFDDTVSISYSSKLKPQDDTELALHIAWGSGGSANGGELSWSDSKNAWSSTKSPTILDMRDNTWDFDDENETDIVIDGAPDSTYVRYRRALYPTSTEDVPVYSRYSDTFQFKAGQTLSSKVTTVTISNDAQFVIENEDIPLEWVSDGIIGKSIVNIIATATGVSDTKTIASLDDVTTYVVPWAEVAEALAKVDGLENARVALQVSAKDGAGGAGGSYVQSNQYVVNVATDPEFYLTVPDKCHDAVPSFLIWTEEGDVEVDLVVVASANSRNAVEYEQYAGDTVWSTSAAFEGTAVGSWEPPSLDDAEDDYEDALADYEQVAEAVTTARAAVDTALAALETASDYVDTLDPDDAGWEQAMSAMETAAGNVTSAREALAAMDVSEQADALSTAITTYADAICLNTAPDTPAGSVMQVQLPQSAVLMNNSKYEVSVTMRNTVTGLTSVRSAEFSTEFLRTVVSPLDVTAQTIDVTQSDGTHVIAADVTFTPSPEHRTTDVYDLYRMSNGNPYLIAEGLARGTVVRDMYAPFGNTVNFYTVACRSIDGDVATDSCDYSLLPQGYTDDGFMRIDWDGMYVELEGVPSSDDYSTDVKLRKHLDGSRNAYWNPGHDRSSSYSTTLVRVEDEATRDKLAELGRHDGPCFVRHSNGSAYQAYVASSSIATRNGSAAISYSVKTTEVDMTEEFMGEVLENGGA